MLMKIVYLVREFAIQIKDSFIIQRQQRMYCERFIVEVVKCIVELGGPRDVGKMVGLEYRHGEGQGSRAIP